MEERGGGCDWVWEGSSGLVDSDEMVGVKPEVWTGRMEVADPADETAFCGVGYEELEVEKCESIQAATWVSRAVSEPSGPWGGRAEWQMGHSSSSRRIGCGGGRGGSGVVTSSIDL